MTTLLHPLWHVVIPGGNIGNIEQDDGENGNTDLKYYDIMDANDKL